MMLQGAARNLRAVPRPRAERRVRPALEPAGGAADLPSPREVLASVGLGRPGATSRWRSCPPGSCSSPRWRSRWPRGPGCCSPTSRPASSTTPPGTRCCRPSPGANRELGTTVLLVTHDPAVARGCPVRSRSGTGRSAARARLGEEYAVVTADGFLPLPAHALPSLPPGTLVRVRPVAEGLPARGRGPGCGRAGVRATGPLRVDAASRSGTAPWSPSARLDFAVPPGGMLAVTGPSGAGKSSLLWALAGATAPARAPSRSDGVPVAGPGPRRRRGASPSLPQGNGLPSFLTAEENVLVPLLARGRAGRRGAGGRARAALALLGPGGVRDPPRRRAVRRPAAAGRAGPHARRRARA